MEQTEVADAAVATSEPGRRSSASSYRWLGWLTFAVALGLLPFVFTAGFSLSLLQQAGVMIVFALSYNMLFGQSGMLSFGHALYFGMGAYFTLHAINAASAGAFPLPLPLMPIVGGLAGAGFGVVFGYLSTRRAGTTFAMISLGLGELIHAAALMFSFFGGEGGISGDRVYGEPIFGFSFGPAIEVYYLIAVWCFLCALAMYAFTRTPLGRIANAVRDNAERVEFIGYNPRKVRWLVLIVSGFFAGVAGALFAINYEIVTADSTNLWRSGSILLATYIGGVTVFFGPVIGAIIFTLFSVALSEMTSAWPLYLGLFFILIVLLSPEGVAGVLVKHGPVLRSTHRSALLRDYAFLLVPLVMLVSGLVLVVEMAYRLADQAVGAGAVTIFDVSFDAASGSSWVAAITMFMLGSLLFVRLLPRARSTWDMIAEEAVAARGRRS